MKRVIRASKQINLNLSTSKIKRACKKLHSEFFKSSDDFYDKFAEVDWDAIHTVGDIGIDILLLVRYGLVDGEDYQIGNGENDIMIRDHSDERWKKVASDLGNAEAVNSSKSITSGKKFYFGMEASAEYGDMIAEKLAGKTISKRRDKGEQPGGLVYEAKELGIDMWDLLEALEGMCHEGRAQEIDDSTYRVNDAVNASTQLQNESTYEVYYIQDGREYVEFDGTEDECNEYIDEITPEQEDEYGDEYPERYVRRKKQRNK